MRKVVRSGMKTRIADEGGFTLVELMIALVLGLMIIAGVIGVFLSNKQTYSTNNALGQVQDNARVAFELMARDIRQAGLTGCGDLNRVANVLNDGPNNGGTDWYANFNNALVGYDANVTDPALITGTATTNRVATTSSIELIGASGLGLSVNFDTAPGVSIHINEASSGLVPGDIVMICNPDHAAIFQVSTPSSGNQIVDHNKGNSDSPGNCSKGLGFPTDCSSTNGNVYQWPQNSSIFKLAAVDWYIGYNPLGGTSLYRMTLVNTAGVPTPTAQEMVRNASNLIITYLVPGNTSFVNAAGVANWSQVTAVTLALNLQSVSSNVATNTTALSPTNALTRPITTTVTLRNRVQ
ncbi:MAG: prepilin-type N-terminal cleavage/methylation domain-containing protein [Stenotrophobium sp.]